MKKITAITVLLTVSIFLSFSCQKDIETMPTGTIEADQKIGEYPEGSTEGYPVELSVINTDAQEFEWTIVYGGEIYTRKGNNITVDFPEPGEYEILCTLTKNELSKEESKTITVLGQTARVYIMNDEDFAENSTANVYLYESMTDLENGTNEIEMLFLPVSDVGFFTNLIAGKDYFVKANILDENNTYYENTDYKFTAETNKTVVHNLYFETN